MTQCKGEDCTYFSGSTHAACVGGVLATNECIEKEGILATAFTVERGEVKITQVTG